MGTTDRTADHRPAGRARGRAGLVAGTVLALALSGGAVGAGTALLPPERPEGCASPDRHLDLYAVELPPADNGQVRLGYGRTPDTASYPGPTIEMVEGECLAVTLHNRVPAATLERLRQDPQEPLGVSLHTHGVRYTQRSDGTAHTGSYVAPGGSRTYTWFAEPADRAARTPGTAGYWWYHDHVVGTSHGTQGIRSGLFGALVVRRPGDPRPDHTFVTAFGDRQTVNLRRYPDTDTCAEDGYEPGPTCFAARQGERVEFVAIGTGDEMHTWHLHGHAWADTRTGTVEPGRPWADSVPVVDNRTMGPGDSFGFQVLAGDSVGPGAWMLHCHVQFHSDLGMSTVFHVLDENGEPVHPAGAHGTRSPHVTTGVDSRHGH